MTSPFFLPPVPPAPVQAAWYTWAELREGIAPRRRGEISAAERRSLVALVLLAHVAGTWALMQVDGVRALAREAAPMLVDLVAPAPAEVAPKSPLPSPPVPRPLPHAPGIPAPILTAPPLVAPAPGPEVFTAPSPEPVSAPPAPAPMVAAPPQPANSPPAPPPAPPQAQPPAPPPELQRKLIAATAVQYLRLPPVEVPHLSRRAGESGTVWLRVVVDVRGQPVQVSVQRSSGHARLDEQAQWAMRQARFKPHTENGQPIELEVVAPIEYTLE